ncbi:BQ5605_C001g00206 [Microbotryum silenes-dioicae]|uniref:BQ5605_C001g00206 protein n=1 Tax=Microbotryum silenes-dioicae TaxID=796604 RepID=A0A2X0P5J5_9BASI|nr:BQ5605_C001g00206 [Microbotryum silenes-dioicae]
MVNSEVSLKPLLATNVPMIFTLLVSINFTETGYCFVYLRDILEEVAELTGLALQEDSCFDYWVVDDAATSSTHSTPCLASCRYDQLAAFTAATDSSDKVLGLTGFVLDIDSLPAEAAITLRVYEHIKARLPFVNITTRPQGRVDAPVPIKGQRSRGTCGIGKLARAWRGAGWRQMAALVSFTLSFFFNTHSISISPIRLLQVD